MGVIIFILFIIVWGIPMLRESSEDAKHREWARKNGYDTYYSSTGCRSVSSNKKTTTHINLNKDYYKK